MSGVTSQSIWLIADTHFGAQPRDRVRATGLSPARLDETIAASWRASIGRDDVVWHLGDVGDFATVAALPGRKRLVFGNGETRKSAIASGAFEIVEKRLSLNGVELVHDPLHARTQGPVFHGHLHDGNDERSAFVCLSVDQTSLGPIRLGDAIQRLERQTQPPGA